MKSWNEQDGRLRQTFAIAETGHEVRIPGGALDSVIRLATAEAILHDLREDEKFTRVMRGIDPKIVKYLRMSEKILFKAEELILGGITAGQLKSILNQCQHVNVTLSAVPVAMCDNMEHDDLRKIVKAATSSDNCSSCVRSGDEVKACELRKALDTVPGMEQRGGMVVAGMCPYGAMWGDEMDE